MQLHPAAEDDLEPRLHNFYCAPLSTLQRAQVPFLVGGAYALACHTGVVRHTKYFDYERGCPPAFVMDTLLDRLRSEAQPPPTVGRLCQGTLLSKVQYAIEVDHWGYEDARLLPLKEKARL
jgi:hypothetical protein